VQGQAPNQKQGSKEERKEESQQIARTKIALDRVKARARKSRNTESHKSQTGQARGLRHEQCSPQDSTEPPTKNQTPATEGRESSVAYGNKNGPKIGPQKSPRAIALGEKRTPRPL